jgi:ribosome-binding factor A
MACARLCPRAPETIMSRNHQKGGEPSHRMLRVGELVRHAMSELLSRGALNDPVLDAHVVTVPRVRMSPDLKLATIYVMPLGGGDRDKVIAALSTHAKYLRAEVARRINTKFSPDVRFRIDDSFDNADAIDQLLNMPQVKRDLPPRRLEGDDEDGGQA